MGSIIQCRVSAQLFNVWIKKEKDLFSWHFQEHVSHPFAVAVFKDNIYWDDWKLNAVFSADKDHGVGIVRLQSDLQGVMDLKVCHSLSLKVLHVY